MVEHLPTVITLISFGFVTWIVSVFLIHKNKDHIFISLRSPNFLQLNNFCIFTCITIVSIEYGYYPFVTGPQYTSLSFQIFSNLYFIFYVITLCANVFKYFRIISSSQIDFHKDDLDNFKYFNTMEFHFEFYLMRILLISIGIFSLFILFLSLVFDLRVTPICFIEPYDVHLHIKSVVFWMILHLLETTILVVCAYYLFNTDLKARLEVEIFLLIILNTLYFIIEGFNFLIRSSYEPNHPFIVIVYLIMKITLIVDFPIMLCRFDDGVVRLFTLTRHSVNNLYLFLGDERCYTFFERFVLQQQSSRTRILGYLSLYFQIMNYRIRFIIESSNTNKLRDANAIRDEYFNPNSSNKEALEGLLGDTWKKTQERCEELLSKNECSVTMFDSVLEKVFAIIGEVFIQFKRSEEYYELLDEINYETFIRCKLTNCGLLKK